MKKKYAGSALALLILAGCGSAAAQPSSQAPAEPPAEPVTLTVAGSWEDCKAIEAVGRAFTTQYPNCTIEYEYLQDYYNSLQKRMNGENAIDLFFCNNIQEGSELLPYALDMNSCEGLDLSQTFDGLIENFTFREEGAAPAKLYAIPLGAELRGLYVNKTLLDSLKLEIPTDQATLLHACEVLREHGYIPFHGNPGDFSQTLLYPWVCNLIANAEDPAAAHAMVNAREAGLIELLREPFEFLYTLVENGDYDYKRAQSELGLFTETTDEAYARDFFHIVADGDAWKKADDLGQVAFLPSPISMQGRMDKTKDDYHSGIAYVFLPAPVGKDGGFAYMSPAHGIGANQNSANLEWVVKFLDFLFCPENNKLFAQEFDIVPNTKEAFDYIRTLYDIPDDRISHLGEVTFDYDFYGVIAASLLDISKANNPKYMQTNADGSTSLYPLSYYLDRLEESLKVK